MSEYQNYFDAATRKILDDVHALGGTPSQIRARHNFVESLRSSMTLPTVRMTMVPSFHQMNFYPSQGFCESLTLAWVDKMGPDWQVMQIRTQEWKHGPHFFARQLSTGKILDLTYDQYAVHAIVIPYSMGRPVDIDRRRAKLLKNFLAATGRAGRDA